MMDKPFAACTYIKDANNKKQRRLMMIGVAKRTYINNTCQTEVFENKHTMKICFHFQFLHAIQYSDQSSFSIPIKRLYIANFSQWQNHLDGAFLYTQRGWIRIHFCPLLGLRHFCPLPFALIFKAHHDKIRFNQPSWSLD